MELDELICPCMAGEGTGSWVRGAVIPATQDSRAQSWKPWDRLASRYG
jgi:hypothetical protein